MEGCRSGSHRDSHGTDSLHFCHIAPGKFPHHKKTPFQTNYTFSKPLSCFTHLLLHFTGLLRFHFWCAQESLSLCFSTLPMQSPKNNVSWTRRQNDGYGQQGRKMQRDLAQVMCKATSPSPPWCKQRGEERGELLQPLFCLLEPRGRVRPVGGSRVCALEHFNP